MGSAVAGSWLQNRDHEEPPFAEITVREREQDLDMSVGLLKVLHLGMQRASLVWHPAMTGDTRAAAEWCCWQLVVPGALVRSCVDAQPQSLCRAVHIQTALLACLTLSIPL